MKWQNEFLDLRRLGFGKVRAADRKMPHGASQKSTNVILSSHRFDLKGEECKGLATRHMHQFSRDSMTQRGGIGV
jgi:hypothetical protein